jgi:hypothetical protein
MCKENCIEHDNEYNFHTSCKYDQYFIGVSYAKSTLKCVMKLIMAATVLTTSCYTNWAKKWCEILDQPEKGHNLPFKVTKNTKFQ